MRHPLFCFLLLLPVVLPAGRLHAQSNTDSLMRVAARMPDDTTKVNLLRDIAWNLAFTDPKSSVEYCYKGLALAQRLKWDKGQANMYHVLGMTCEITGDYQKGMEANLKAIAFRKVLHDTLGLGKSYGNIGNLYYAQGNIPKALEYYLLSTQMFSAAREPRMLATTWVNIGVIYQNQADYPTSLNYMLKGLSIMEQSGYTEGIGYAMSNLGVTYAGLGEHRKAVAAHRASLAIDRKTNNDVGAAHSLNNLGNSYYHLGLNDSALIYLHEGYALFKKQGDEQGMSSIMFDEALILHQAGQTQQAIEKQLAALEIRLKDTGFVRPAAESCIHLSEMYIAQKKYAKALAYSTRGLQLALRSGDNNVYLTAMQAQARALLRNGRGADAAELLERYIVLRDSLFSAERANQLTRKELEFGFEKDRLADSLSHAAEQKRNILELDRRNAQLAHERMLFYFLLTLAVLLLLVGYQVYRAYRRKQKDNAFILAQKQETELQKAIVEEKNKEILDSIQYAKKIQFALLANRELMNNHLPPHFVFFQPRSVVSGDFYWAAKKTDANGFYLAVCDSTGHGVPGAFMSLLNTSYLNEAVAEKQLSDPHKIFDHVRQQLIRNMAHEGQKDGMDGILARFDGRHSLHYAAANNAPLVIRNGQVMELPFDKIPVGHSHHLQDFQLYHFAPLPGDVLYLFTDGYADQFGGEKGKKFKHKNMQLLLASIHHLPLQEQEEQLRHHFNAWKGDLEQVDDVCIIGMKL